jgi:hypothetical protein
MGEFIDGKNVLLKRPEPGRPIYPIVEKKEQIQNNNIDTNAIADAVIKAIVGKMPSGGININSQINKVDNFDTSDSMSKLADAMVYNSSQNESNLEGLGRIQKTKKDNKDTDKTIDLLSQLGD